jgi:hypothetical protein
VKEFLSSNHVPYQWIDLDRDPSTRELIRSTGDLLGQLAVGRRHGAVNGAVSFTNDEFERAP